jgi:hypothetical protein
MVFTLVPHYVYHATRLWFPSFESLAHLRPYETKGLKARRVHGIFGQLSGWNLHVGFVANLGCRARIAAAVIHIGRASKRVVS